MAVKILLTDLIDEFFDALETKQPRLIVSRKFNQLTTHLSPTELQGIGELWGHYSVPNQAILPHVLDDTLDFLHERYKGIQVFI